MHSITSIYFVLVFIEAQEDYGWKTEPSDILAYDGPCNIERYDGDDLSQKDFLLR